MLSVLMMFTSITACSACDLNGSSTLATLIIIASSPGPQFCREVPGVHCLSNGDEAINECVWKINEHGTRRKKHKQSNVSCSFHGQLLLESMQSCYNATARSLCMKPLSCRYMRNVDRLTSGNCYVTSSFLCISC